MRSNIPIQTLLCLLPMLVYSQDLSGLKDSFAGSFGDVKNTFNTYSTDIKKAFDSMGGETKERFNNALAKLGIKDMDFTKMKADDLANKLSSKEINALDPQVIASMDSAEIDKLMTNAKIPPRVKKNIDAARARALSPDKAINELGKTNSKAKIRELLKAAPKFEDLKVKDVDQMKDVIFKAPFGQLLKVKEPAAVRRIYQLFRFCTDGINAADDSDSCSEITKMTEKGKANEAIINGFKNKLIKRGYGDIDANDIDQIGVQNIDEEIAKMIPAAEFKKRQSAVKDRKLNCQENTETCQIIAKKLMEADKISSNSDVDQVTEIINNYGHLKQYVNEEDLKGITKDKLQGTPLDGILKTNVDEKAKMGKLNRKELRDRMKGVMRGKLTKDTIAAAGPAFTSMPRKRLEKAIADGLVDPLEVVQNLQKNIRPGSQAKVRKFADQALAALTVNGQLQVSNLPNNLAQFAPPSSLKTLTSGAKSEMSMKKTEFTDLQKNALLDKVSASNVANHAPQVLENLPITKVKGESRATLRNIAKDLPPTAPVFQSMITTELDSMKTVTPANINEPTTRGLRVTDVKKIPAASMREVLKKMVDLGVQPSQAASRELGNKLQDQYASEVGSGSRRETARMITTTEIEETPPCVITSMLGEEIKTLDADKKQMLLEAAAGASDRSCMPKRIRQLLVREGLAAEGKTSGGLSIDNLQSIGEMVVDAPASMVSQITDTDAINSLVQILNSGQMSENPPCLNKDMVSSIRSVTKKYLGNLREVEPEKSNQVCCLLWTLSREEMNSIPSESSSCTCEKEPMSETMKPQRMALCEAESDGMKTQEMGEMNWKSTQNKKEVDFIEDSTEARRRRRQTTTDETEEISTCDKIEMQGVNAISDTELNAMTGEEVTACLDSIGVDDDMLTDKCVNVKNKFKAHTDDFKTMTKAQIKQLNKVLKCFEKDEIELLPAIDTLENVAVIGALDDQTKEQAETFYNRIASDYKKPEAFTAEDVIAANNIVCGFPKEAIDAIPVDAFTDSMATLSKLDDCDYTTLSNLATKATTLYGSPDKLTSAEVSQMGVLVGGFKPHEVIKLTPSAIAGLSPDAVESMPVDTFKVLSSDQLGGMSAESLANISDEQQSALPGEVQDLLDSLQQFVGKAFKSSATSVIPSVMSILLLLGIFLA